MQTKIKKTHEDLWNQGMNSGATYIYACLFDKAEKSRQIYSPTRDEYCIYPAIHDVSRNDFNPLMYFVLIVSQLESHYFRSDIQEELVSYIVEKVTCK
jgi:hypothetical protein